ncbi:MAG: integrase core domain-containing protein [Nitrospira sp.]|nr:integrase core domain-containing protein [Nitrospira sp.]
MIEDWRRLYKQQRPHSTLGYQTPATAYWGAASPRAGSGKLRRDRVGKIAAHS